MWKFDMLKWLFPKDQNIRKHIDDGSSNNQSFDLMLFHSYAITPFVKSPKPTTATSAYHIVTPPFIPHSHVKLPPPYLSSCTLLRNHMTHTPFRSSFAVQSLSAEGGPEMGSL